MFQVRVCVSVSLPIRLFSNSSHAWPQEHIDLAKQLQLISLFFRNENQMGIFKIFVNSDVRLINCIHVLSFFEILIFVFFYAFSNVSFVVIVTYTILIIIVKKFISNCPEDCIPYKNGCRFPKLKLLYSNFNYGLLYFVS